MRGESHADALRREIVEELDTDVVVNDLVLETAHAYPDTDSHAILLSLRSAWNTKADAGSGDGVDPRSELSSLLFPPADNELIRMLRRVTWARRVHPGRFRRRARLDEVTMDVSKRECTQTR